MLFIVIRENRYFKRGSHVELDDEGFRQVTLIEKGRGWSVKDRGIITIEPNAELINSLVALDGKLPDDILHKIRGH